MVASTSRNPSIYWIDVAQTLDYLYPTEWGTIMSTLARWGKLTIRGNGNDHLPPELSPEIRPAITDTTPLVRVDLNGWVAMGGPWFARLQDPTLFARVAVADYGATIQWAEDDNLVIDSHHLSLLAEQQCPFERTEMAAWQDRLNLSNQEAADLLGIRLRAWHDDRTGTTRIPRGVQIACRAVERDQVLFAAHFKPRHPGWPSIRA